MGWFSSRQRKPGRLAVFAEQAAHPRDCGELQWRSELSLPRIGYFIDWLDSRPEHQVSDQTAIDCSRSNAVAQIAAMLANRTPAERVEFSVVSIPWVDWNHTDEYDPDYHAHVAACLQEDELEPAWGTYRKLLAVRPECVSAMVNLAELERRVGNTPGAERLLDEALEWTSRGGVRHRIADADWRIHVRCALARLGRVEPNADADPIIAMVRKGNLEDAATRLYDLCIRYYPPMPREQARQRAEELTVAMHAAFGRADTSERMSIHAAIRSSGATPVPPPSWYPDRETLGRVIEIARGVSERRTR